MSRQTANVRDASRLLIVDDDPLIRLVALDRLVAEGFNVIEAEGGTQGIEIFRDERPDLVLLDVEMPGLDGFEVCDAIRRTPAGKHVPILILTGLNDLGSIERAYEVGATDFISKPLNWVVLSHRIRYMLRASQSFQAVRSQQARLDEVQQHARLGSWELQLSTGLVSGSQAMQQILGLSPGVKLPAAPELLDRVHPDDREGVKSLIQDAIQNRTPFSLDHRILSTDGSERVVHTEGRLCTGEADDEVALEGFTQDITDRRRAEEQIRFLVHSDSLTGLSNRVAFRQRLQSEIRRGRRTGRAVAIILLDLDHFKRVNDTFGHSAGDNLLRHVANQLEACVRDDRVARDADLMISRLGGDEFAILLDGLPDPSEAARVSRRILDCFSSPILVEGREVTISASIGIAVWPNDGEDADSLLLNADSAMYHAKERGRSNFQFYREELNAHALERLELEGLLRRAIANDELLVYHQPKVQLASGRITGSECLARWEVPGRGLLYPDLFIPLAEATGLIHALGEQVFRKACEQARRLAQGENADLEVAVNISPGQLQDENLVQMIADTLRETSLPPRLLELEITESALIDSEEHALAVLNELRSMGIRISLDDFGTGFSSLSYLKRFPVQCLKIDKSFTSGIGSDSGDEPIVSATLSMARDLGLRVVAEGIETEAQLRFLRDRHCDDGQGFLFGRAVPVDEFERLLRSHRPEAFIEIS